jgi:hypothetical protein
VSAHLGFFLRRAFAFLALLLLTFCVKGLAQGGASGAVQGDVRDSSGALIAGAEVTLTGEGGGFVRSVRTNNEGIFAATLLPPGI